MRQILRQKLTYDDGRATESLFSATKTFSQKIKQLLPQYNKILALCNIRGFSLNTTRSHYFVVLMQLLIIIEKTIFPVTFSGRAASHATIDDYAKGGLTQFRELFTVIPSPRKDFKRL